MRLDATALKTKAGCAVKSPEGLLEQLFRKKKKKKKTKEDLRPSKIRSLRIVAKYQYVFKAPQVSKFP